MQQEQAGITLTSFPIITTTRLNLIEIDNCHRKDLYKIFSNKKVTQYYNIKTLTKENESQVYIDWFRSSFEAGQGIRWGITQLGSDTIIGTVGFNNYTRDHRANLGYDLHADYWNRGIMSEALEHVINFGFCRLEVNRIEAEVIVGNTKSERLLEKLGFTREGVLRRWMFWNDQYYDMIMFSLLKSDRSFVTKKI